MRKDRTTQCQVELEGGRHTRVAHFRSQVRDADQRDLPALPIQTGYVKELGDSEGQSVGTRVRRPQLV